VAIFPAPTGKDAQGKTLKPLDAASEQHALEETLGGEGGLEIALPATLDDLRRHLAEHKQRVVHFSGYSSLYEGQAALLFEKEGGAPNAIKGRDLVNRIGDTVFLVVMSACSTDKPAPTEFASLAAALVKWGVPYTLGLRATFPAETCALWTRTLYGQLRLGVPVEQAVWQARQELEESAAAWTAGALVFYTALNAPAPAFTAEISSTAIPAEVVPTPTPLQERESAAPVEEVAPPEAEPAVAAAAVPLETVPARKPVPVYLNGEQVQVIAANTVMVMTQAPEKLVEWRMSLRSNYQQVKQLNFQAEIEFFSALLGLLDNVPPSLPPESPYTGVIRAIQDAISGKVQPIKEIDPPKEVMHAVQELLQAKTPAVLRKVIEKRKAQLYRPEAQAFLVSLAREAQSTGEKQALQVLVMYASILQKCQEIGIEATFEKLTQTVNVTPAEAEPSMPLAQEPLSGPIPDGFIERCATGLRGERQAREALFNYLEALPIPEAGFSTLLKTIKLALLGSNPQKLGQDLEGEYAAAWQEIVEKIAGGSL
jgi:hypothetical protein